MVGSLYRVGKCARARRQRGVKMTGMQMFIVGTKTRVDVCCAARAYNRLFGQFCSSIYRAIMKFVLIKCGVQKWTGFAAGTSGNGWRGKRARY